MRIAMAGSSGFLGSHLADRLTSGGHEVTRLVRREPRAAGEIRWDPAGGELNPAALSGMDAVVNLAGASAAGHRWTARYKAKFRASRVDATSTLAHAVAALPAAARPSMLANASAVGWYGDTGDKSVTEEAPAGEGFLADLCRAWEAATRPAEEAGVRVVRLRTGLPMHASGGMLKPLLLPFRLFAGGKLSTGRQYMPWISLADWLGAVEFLMAREDIAGPVNLAGPVPVTNAEFTATLARLLHRPAVFTVPRLALRVVLGDFGDEAVSSQRTLPGVLEREGFSFAHRDIGSALRAALR
ncbi:MAG TPA: TIGR01777 family oxidoreductase [Micromonosporaceae bacterium]|nr:TIGR01777 family oxidoreductase [Micromonosporaceae bacterium]